MRTSTVASAAVTAVLLFLVPLVAHSFDVTVKAGDGGTVMYRNGAGSGTIQAGQETVLAVDPAKKATLTFIPAAGFSLDAVLQDGVDVGTRKKLVLSAKNAPQRVEALFAPTMCPIAVRHGTGGDVTPSPAEVVCGSSAVLTVLPLQQYYIAGIREGAANSGPIVARTYAYTTAPVTKKTKVSVAFAPYPTLTAAAGPGGSISPSGVMQAAPGSVQRFVLTPDPGFRTASLKVDGKPATPVAGTTDTFDVPVAYRNSRISAAFQAGTFSVTGRVDGTGGTISPTSATASVGQSVTFTVTADKRNDFTIRSVTVNGQPRTDIPHNATTYSFSLTVTGDVEVVASFFGKSGAIAAANREYIVLAWNDLGMHCLNPTYDTAVILPPYNTVWAQVVRRGNPPQVVTTGVNVTYRVLNNTSSANKGLFGQFWQYAQKLFGGAPATDFGLNLEDPEISNSLSGSMVVKGDHFQVNGIPVVPIDDFGVKSPYQVIEVTVKDAAGKTLALTTTTIPTSDEIDCGGCHGNTTDPTVAFTNILQKHDLNTGTSLMADRPVLCASCHGSPALGLTTPGSSGMMLSQAVHGFHAHVTDTPLCYDCHPGKSAKCNRSLQHTAADGNCTACHGGLAEVAGSIASGRVPWVNEPRCATCHTPVAQVDTGAVLYRNSTGHGGIYCTACHGSPHAMAPSLAASDNAQAIDLQGVALPLGSCAVCHRSNRGGGNNFAEEHAKGEHLSACSVCHTGFGNAANFSAWPHQFQWKAR